MTMTFLRRPQSHPLRKAIFQIHLWAGITVAAYVLLIGVTGAALVFRPEMQKLTFPEFFAPVVTTSTYAPAGAIIGDFERAYPGYKLLGIDYPTHRRETFLAYLTKGEDLRTVFSNPQTGEVIGELPKTSWITRLQDLHFDLLGGSKGRTINGVGAGVITVLFLTGLVVWWPGIERWAKSLRVSFSSGWKRANWDLHSATGFWLFALLLLWSVSGVEFAFPQQFRQAVNAVSPLSIVRAPESQVPASPNSSAVNVSLLVDKALALVPGAKMGRIVLPSSPKASILILTAYNTHGDFDTSDETLLYFDQYTGNLINRRVPSAEKQSAGDAVMTWIGPLHVGSFGGEGAMGMTVKVLWSVLALSFPALAITGALMWWNRVGRTFVRSARDVPAETGVRA